MSGTLALILDIEFSFDDHINRIATTNVYHLKSISMVKKFLPQTDSEKLLSYQAGSIIVMLSPNHS